MKELKILTYKIYELIIIVVNESRLMNLFRK